MASCGESAAQATLTNTSWSAVLGASTPCEFTVMELVDFRNVALSGARFLGTDLSVVDFSGASVAFLAAEPAFALPERFSVDLHWIPFTLRIKGKGERSEYSEWKARYSYLDARRWANRRGGFRIKGPPKVYDSSPALIGGLYAQREGFFRRYTEEVFARFFARELEIDVPEEIAALIAELGQSARGYREYLAGGGPRALQDCIDEAHRDHVFGVPLFVFRGEPFWGYDRIPLLEERLAECGSSGIR